ncbi:MAG: diguanylate cyclase [Bacillota bacterium]
MKNLRNIKNLSNNPDIIILLSKDGIYKNIWTNRPQDLVAPVEELLNKPIENILPAKIADNFKEKMNLAFKEDKIEKLNYKLKIKEKINYFEATFVGFEKNKVFSFIKNITDRKEIEKELQKSERRYRTLFENFPAIIWEEDFSEVISFAKEIKVGAEDIKNYFNKNPQKVNDLLKKIKVIDVNKTALDFYNAESKKELTENLDKLFNKKTREVFIEIVIAMLKGVKGFRRDTEALTLEGKKKDIRLEWKIPEDKDNYSNVYISILDIGERKMAERVNKRQNAYFQQLFDNSPEAIALLDNREHIIKVNDSFEDIFGYKHEEIEGRKINDIILPSDYEEEGKEITQKVKEGYTVESESVRKTKSGKKIFVSIKGYPITYNDKQLGVYAIYNDITVRKKEENKIKYLSFHDQLTDLYNRRFFEEERDRLENSRDLPISIIVADMDGLKAINDNYGHKKGDEYLKIIAEIIESSVREADIVARIGGDEFAILLPSANKRIASEIENRILVKSKERSKKLKEPLSISTGSATKNKFKESLEEVFKIADKQMYRNKESKKE